MFPEQNTHNNTMSKEKGRQITVDGWEANEMAMKGHRQYKVDVNGTDLPYQREAQNNKSYFVDDFRETRNTLVILRDDRHLGISWDNINFYHVREQEEE